MINIALGHYLFLAAIIFIIGVMEYFLTEKM